MAIPTAIRERVARVRSRATSLVPRTPTEAEAALQSANGRFPGVVYGASQHNPYKPQVSAVDFPIITLPVGPFTPPSINPQPGRPRRGPTPNPVGYTVPTGAFRRQG